MRSDSAPQARRCGRDTGALQLLGRGASPFDQAGDVDSVRRVASAISQAIRPALEQRDGAGGVSAQRVRLPDSELCQALPQLSLIRCGSLPRSFQHLVCLERQSTVEQALRLDQSLFRCKKEVVRHAGDAGYAAR